jgi:pimeloyl-ACP methyl ester carboxylesterase
MSRLLIGRYAAALVAGLVLVQFPIDSRAQAPDSQKISFETIDKVLLRGTFYPSSKDGKKSPPVLLLHKLGSAQGRQSPGFESLAKALQLKGFAVLSFDFRGHGDSTNVKPEFWKYAANNVRTIKGAKPTKEEIDYKEFAPSYYPYLVNDIAAAKFELERRNNAQDCNANDLIVIGADDGATLGALWAATEWQRHRFSPNPNGAAFPSIRSSDPDGKDIAALVFLSMRPNLGSGSSVLPLRGTAVASWFNKDPRVRDKVGLFFLYGDGDDVCAKFAKFLFDDSMHAEKLKNKLLYKMAVKETNLSGSDLLKKGLTTEDWVVKYCSEQVTEKRPGAGWVERDLKLNPLIPISANIVSQYGVTMP